MITDEHLEHWIKQTRIRLDAMKSEISEKKLTPYFPLDAKPRDGVQIDLSTGQSVHVSFEYLREKIMLIEGFMKCIEDDVEND